MSRKAIESYQEAKDLIARYFKPGIQTNGIPSGELLQREVEQGTLFAHAYGGGLFLLRERPHHILVTYLLTNPDVIPELDLEKRAVVEIPFRPGAEKILPPLWDSLSFAPLFYRIRMKRPKRDAVPLPVPPCSHTPEEVMALLRTCFDETTACLPTGSELSADLAEGRVLVQEVDGVLAGCLRVRQQGNTAEIRHLAVLPDFRGRGIGDALTKAFSAAFPDRLAHVWVREDYPAPQKIYQANGFTPDGYQSAVLQTKGDQP